MIFFILVIVLTGLLTAFVAGNNLSAAVGTLIGARITSKLVGQIIGILGFSSGLLLEGTFLNKAATSIMERTPPIVAYVLFISLILFVVATFLRSPLSLTMALVGTAVGVSFRIGYSVSGGYILLLVSAWVAAPILSILISMYASRKMSDHNFRNPWRAAYLSKIALIVISFFTAFTLGANTLGLIGAVAGITPLILLIMVIGIIFGTMTLGAGVIKRVGEEMYSMRYSNAMISLLVSSAAVEAATFVGVPLSNTQTLTSSVLGTGLSYKYKAIYLKPFLIVVITWIFSPLIGFALGYLF
jgi:PiT family inorganic phosphate transporter